MNDINTAKARRLMMIAGLLIVDLAGERIALRKLAAQAVHYTDNQQPGKG